MVEISGYESKKKENPIPGIWQARLAFSKICGWEEKTIPEIAKYKNIDSLTDKNFQNLWNEHSPIGDIKIWESIKVKKIELSKDSNLTGLDNESPLLIEATKKMLYGDTKVVAYELNLSEVIDEIGSEKWKKFQDLTRLKNGRLRIFMTQGHLDKYDGDVSKAIGGAKKRAKIFMGWDSCLETAEKYPAQICREIDDCIAITFDAPGQFRSELIESKELMKDSFLQSVENYNLSAEAMMRLVGLEDREDVSNLFIGHSRGGLTVLRRGINEFKNPRNHFLIFAPVPKYDSIKDLYIKLLTGVGSHIGTVPLMKSFVDAVSPLITHIFIGNANDLTKKLHNFVYKNTDKVVLATYIIRLLNTPIPSYLNDLMNVNSDSEIKKKLKIFIPQNDKFTDTRNIIGQLMNSNKLSVARIMTKGHYGFLSEVDRGIFLEAMAFVKIALSN